MSAEGIKKSGEITVSFVSDAQIRALNKKYAHKGHATDVLAFDESLEKGNITADIVISVQAAARNSRVFKTTPLYELYLYVIHGLLHLLGYDDINPAGKQIMDKRQLYLYDKYSL